MSKQWYFLGFIMFSGKMIIIGFDIIGYDLSFEICLKVPLN